MGSGGTEETTCRASDPPGRRIRTGWAVHLFGLLQADTESEAVVLGLLLRGRFRGCIGLGLRLRLGASLGLGRPGRLCLGRRLLKDPKAEALGGLRFHRLLGRGLLGRGLALGSCAGLFAARPRAGPLFGVAALGAGSLRRAGSAAPTAVAVPVAIPTAASAARTAASALFPISTRRSLFARAFLAVPGGSLLTASRGTLLPLPAGRFLIALIARNRTAPGPTLAFFVAGGTGFLATASAIPSTSLFASGILALAPASATATAATGASALATGATAAVASSASPGLGVLSVVVLAGDL